MRKQALKRAEKDLKKNLQRRRKKIQGKEKKMKFKLKQKKERLFNSIMRVFKKLIKSRRKEFEKLWARYNKISRTLENLQHHEYHRLKQLESKVEKIYFFKGKL